MSSSTKVLQAKNSDSNAVIDAESPARDATQLRLRISELRYRRLFEAARDGILILDAVTLRITDVNPFMTELLGYSHAEFLGKELWEIGLFSDKEASQAAFKQLQRTGYLRYEDLPLQATNGKLTDVEFVSNVYEEDSHQVIQCNIRDITARKRAEKERTLLLAAAQSARAEADSANGIKDEFLATLSHELRTPLTSILGWSQLLTTANLDKQQTNCAIETIARNARAQGRLIDELLDISRIITGKLCLDPRAVRIAPLIQAVVDDVRPGADARSINLEATFNSDIGPILGDPDRLQQIVWNLLSNAIKFTPKGGDVQVRLERNDSHALITISDTGQGIAPELLPHVFERFRQADSSNTRSNGGLGLGLSIVRQLVELHRGTVTAESSGENAGTTFRVMLPLPSLHEVPNPAEKTEPKNERNSRSTAPHSLSGLRVLVVDDELDTRELVATVLMTCGAEVVSVGSATEALEQMERQRFDLLISDIAMPEMNGYDLIGRIRQLGKEQGGRTPAVALTAYAGINDRKRALAAGYEMHIPKPFVAAELISAAIFLTERQSGLA
ncbi:MAG TPA: ATP-binding protein [Pyrinomonadaceae bacterium]|jgi:PAS domain S-box-containing protein|nr:ATP-binding protein [Pyrinomonadaceae bacterium]